MENVIKVYVYKVDGLLGPEYKVYPPVLILGKGAKCQFINMVSDKDAELNVPDGPFVGGGFKEKFKKESKERQADGAPVVVQYEVKVDSKKASGNSDPVIIIDP